MDKSITKLEDVTSRSRNSSVRVRVLNVWWQSAVGKDPMMEMILGDEHGGRMAASLRGKSIEQWKNTMTEGATVFMRHFIVAANGTVNGHKYLPTSHKYKIVFSPTTIVRPIQDFTASRHGFNFTSFSDIAANDHIKDQDCVDVIGCLYKMGEIVAFKKGGVDTTRMVCYLKDLESVQLKLTLFGKFTELLTDEVSKQDPNRPVVIILQFGKINEYRNVKGVANAFNGSKLFVNNDIDEIREFLQRYDGTLQFERIESVTTQSTITNPCDFFKDCDHVPLADYMTHEQDGWYVAYATIDSIDADEPWWYSACKPCNRKVIRLTEAEKGEGYVGSGLKCPGCGPNPKSLFPKFKVYVRVINDTGSSSFTLFDNHIRTLIGMSAHDLRKRYLDDPDIIPEELNEIVGRSFLFKFEISGYNRREDYHYYTVASLTDDNATIMEFKKAFNIETETPAHMDAITHATAAYIEDGPSSVKDTASVTADNTSAIDVTASTAESPHGKRPAAVLDNDPISVKSSVTKTKKRLL